MTVNSVLRSENSFFGKTEAIANAAEAPQIATAPPVSTPRRQPRFINRAMIGPDRKVKTMPTMTITATLHPAARI